MKKEEEEEKKKKEKEEEEEKKKKEKKEEEEKKKNLDAVQLRCAGTAESSGLGSELRIFVDSGFDWFRLLG
ncbi:hypothetical protein ZWY2020_028110 [Hordeum vulgare]|nr:hypothetical protein ZWY2020_028110 [Hordeum vulgare]